MTHNACKDIRERVMWPVLEEYTKYLGYGCGARFQAYARARGLPDLERSDMPISLVVVEVWK